MDADVVERVHLPTCVEQRDGGPVDLDAQLAAPGKILGRGHRDPILGHDGYLSAWSDVGRGIAGHCGLNAAHPALRDIGQRRDQTAAASRSGAT